MGSWQFRVAWGLSKCCWTLSAADSRPAASPAAACPPPRPPPPASVAVSPPGPPAAGPLQLVTWLCMCPAQPPQPVSWQWLHPAPGGLGPARALSGCPPVLQPLRILGSLRGPRQRGWLVTGTLVSRVGQVEDIALCPPFLARHSLLSPALGRQAGPCLF